MIPTTQESGEARRARQDDQQASLHSIVTCAAAAIEQAIKYAAQWLKLDSTKYAFTVEPEFIVQQSRISIWPNNFMKVLLPERTLSAHIGNT